MSTRESVGSPTPSKPITPDPSESGLGKGRKAARGRRPGPAVRRGRPPSGLVAAAVVGAFTVTLLRDHGVPTADVVVFAAYLVLGLGLPGTLLWRALRGGPGHLAEDLAAGTALGYAIEVLTYLPARWAGVPRLFLAWPVLTLAAFTCLPGLRRHWRGSGQRAPVLWSWSVAAVAGFVILEGALPFFRQHGLTWPGNAAPYVDMPFHLSLIGELKHHLPPVAPWVAGEPLRYHWFVYADMAATSWATGIEPQTLLFRLSILPMVIAFVVLVPLIGRRLTRSWWPGVAALAISVLLVSPDAGGGLSSRLPTGAAFGAINWLSPTQTFGALLFAPVVLLLTDLLRGTDAARSARVPLGVLLVACLGGKATYLPMLVVGLLTVAATEAVTLRRVRARTVLCAGAAAAGVVVMRYTLMRGTTGALTLSPLATMREVAAAITPHPRQAPELLAVALVTVLGWGCAWAGTFGLARGRVRGSLPDPAVVLLCGIGASAIGAALFLGQPGISQLYFLAGARPYLALTAACGFAALVQRADLDTRNLAPGAGTLPVSRSAKGGRPWRVRPQVPARVLSAAAALLAGAGVAAGVHSVFGGPGSWAVRAHRHGDLVGAVLDPYAALLAGAAVAAAVVAAVVTALGAGKVPALRGIRLVIVPLVLTGLTVPAALGRAELTWRTAMRPAAVVSHRTMSRGGMEAARWLRDHSSPDDLVATNAHCRFPGGQTCENRHFWVSAYSERRMLVEGWGYTATANAQVRLFVVGQFAVPFWDPRRLADNDAAFGTPSPATLDRLRDHYGVRWLFVDRNGSAPVSADLGRFATLRFRSGACAVYELRR